jgi:flagellar protein FlbD
MIPLTRPDGSVLLVNPDRIETVEETPDTVVTLADGKKLLVREPAAVVAERFVGFQRAIHSGARFGGRRRTDPPGEADPTAYEHPRRSLMAQWPARSVVTESPASSGESLGAQTVEPARGASTDQDRGSGDRGSRVEVGEGSA